MSKNYYILFYEYSDDYLEKRGEVRRQHMELVDGYAKEGKLLLGGAYDNPADGAALIFFVEDKADVEKMPEIDPYVKAGLVKKWRIREYKVVIGSACENPIDISSL